MYLEIELPVFCMTEEQEVLFESGTIIPLDEIEIKIMTFYTIDNLQEITEQVSMISSGGEDFTINLSYQVLKGKIRESKIPNFS